MADGNQKKIWASLGDEKKSKSRANDSQYFNGPALYLAEGRKSREKEDAFQFI